MNAKADDMDARAAIMKWLEQIEIQNYEILFGHRELDPEETGNYVYREYEPTDERTLVIRGRLKRAE